MQVPFVTSQTSVPILGHAFYKVEQATEARAGLGLDSSYRRETQIYCLLENSGERLFFSCTIRDVTPTWRRLNMPWPQFKHVSLCVRILRAGTRVCITTDGVGAAQKKAWKR